MTESLYSKVRSIIDTRLDAGEIVALTWITHQIVADHDGIQGEDAEFYRLCAYDAIQRVAKRVLGKYEASTTPDAQLIMDGFEHAQRAYPVERNGERVLVPTDLLTAEELEARASEYDRMAAGCRAHAKELRYLARTRMVAAE